MKILILDDREVRHEFFKSEFKYKATLIHVYTAKDCISALENFNFDAVYLDHDLNGGAFEPSDSESGYAVAQWIALNPHRKPPTVVIHSLNREGVSLMKQCIPSAIVKPCYVF